MLDHLPLCPRSVMALRLNESAAQWKRSFTTWRTTECHVEFLRAQVSNCNNGSTPSAPLSRSTVPSAPSMPRWRRRRRRRGGRRWRRPWRKGDVTYGAMGASGTPEGCAEIVVNTSMLDLVYPPLPETVSCDTSDIQKWVQDSCNVTA